MSGSDRPRPTASAGLATVAASPAHITTLRREWRSASTPPRGTATRNPAVRVASTTPSPVPVRPRSSTASPRMNGNAQVASPEAVAAAHSRRKAASRSTDRRAACLDVSGTDDDSTATLLDLPSATTRRLTKMIVVIYSGFVRHDRDPRCRNVSRTIGRARKTASDDALRQLRRGKGPGVRLEPGPG